MERLKVVENVSLPDVTPHCRSSWDLVVGCLVVLGKLIGGSLIPRLVASQKKPGEA
jgi:hypothetical protein